MGKTDFTNLSDKELNSTIDRLRREIEATRLTKEQARYQNNTKVSKSVSIKEATDDELELLRTRLMKERDVQDLVLELQRRSNRFTNYDNAEVSTDAPIESMYHKGFKFNLDRNNDGQKSLSHFGIKGMKWGKRNRVVKTEVKHEPKSKGSEDHIKKVSLKGKRLKDMSNAELKALNERMQLEKQYKDLTKTEMSPGQKFVRDVLTEVATQTVKSYAKKYATNQVEALLKTTTK